MKPSSRAMALIVGLAEHAHGLAAGRAHALRDGQQVAAPHRLGERDFDYDFAGGIGLFAVVAIGMRRRRSLCRRRVGGRTDGIARRTADAESRLAALRRLLGMA